MLLADFIKESAKALEALYPAPEAHSMVLLLCEERLGVMSYTHVTEPGTEIPEEDLPGLLADRDRLLAAEPLQYVLGCTEFCGRVFDIDKRALIPRAETEMLCRIAEEMARELGLAPDMAQGTLKILDLCTGSGCIAWTLALDLAGSEVTGVDISPDALDLAGSQPFRVRRPAIRPKFMPGDILDDSLELPSCNLLTANPPYVMVREKDAMRSNVLDWEPHLAIFAPEGDPLVFHRAIAAIARKALLPGGAGILEINDLLSEESCRIFRDAGFAEVGIVPDFFGRKRFLRFRVRNEAAL